MKLPKFLEFSPNEVEAINNLEEAETSLNYLQKKALEHLNGKKTVSALNESRESTIKMAPEIKIPTTPIELANSLLKAAEAVDQLKDEMPFVICIKKKIEDLLK